MISRLLKPRTLLRDLLGIRALETRLHEVEDLVRLWAGRSGEATALDQVIERLEQLVAHLPVDEETRDSVGELRDVLALGDRAGDIAELHRRIDQLEERLLESHDEVHQRSRQRWREAQPDDRLTWMRALSGDPFIAKLEEHGAFADGCTVVEIGPGYGRLLRSLLERRAPFARYVGVDLSAQNLEHLRRTFSDPRLTFLHADVESVDVSEPVDVVYSSLTFKHFYPSFEAALARLGSQMRSGGRIFFDLVEGHRRYFEPDGVTFLRFYRRDEIAAILERTGFELETFDEVLHDEDHPRLLVVARRG